MNDKITEAPEAASGKERDREVSDRELDKVAGGSPGGGDSSSGSRWNYDNATGRRARRD